MSPFLTILGNILIVCVIYTYFNQVRKGDSTPNASTWFIWLVVMAINAVTYYLMMKGNLWQSLYTAIVAVGMLLICGYSAWYGKFSKIRLIDKICFIGACAICIFWRLTNDALLANVLLQVIVVISFIPTIRGLLKHEIKEKGFPWYLAVVTYTIILFSLTISDDFQWGALAYPFFNGILGNGSVAAIIFWQSRD